MPDPETDPETRTGRRRRKRKRKRETTCFEDRRVLPAVFEYKKQVMFNMTVFLTVDLVAKLDLLLP